jgi:hypothetical protein
MIILCPYCGFKLSKILEDGISSCDNCQRIFDSSSHHKVLSALWLYKKWNWCAETITQHFQFSEEEAKLINEFIDKQYSYEDYVKILNK